MSEITSETIFRVAELHRTIKEQAAENAELRAEVSRLRDWMQRVTDAVLDWRTKVTGTTGSGCPIDAVVILAARLRRSEAEIERLRALLAGYEAMETSMKQEAK